LTEGVDLYQYRYECWRGGEFSYDESDFCSDTYDILYEQYTCYDASYLYTPQYCEADKLTNPEEPTADIFQECLFDISYFNFTRADICDYAYPVDNEYFGEYNEGCLAYEEYVRNEEELEFTEPETPNETEQPDDEEFTEPETPNETQ
jgi:hypothetical protein